MMEKYFPEQFNNWDNEKQRRWINYRLEQLEIERSRIAEVSRLLAHGKKINISNNECQK